MRWLKGPDWASGSANTSSGTGGGTARATTSILEKYCSKVSKGGINVFLLSIMRQKGVFFILNCYCNNAETFFLDMDMDISINHFKSNRSHNIFAFGQAENENTWL